MSCDDGAVVKGESCWDLQKEEILLLMSVYCGEGECVVTSRTPQSSTAALLEEEVAMDALCDMREPGQATFDVSVKLALEGEADVLVRFSLSSLYPKSDAPTISVTSPHMASEDLALLAQHTTSHSTTVLPRPCLLDILEKIKDNIMTVRLRDPMCWSDQRANVKSTLTTNTNKTAVMPCQMIPHGKFSSFEEYVFLCRLYIRGTLGGMQVHTVCFLGVWAEERGTRARGETTDQRQSLVL